MTQIADLIISRIDSAHYHYAVSYAGSILFEDSGFTRISAALQAAAEDGSSIPGLQLSFAGITVGTYTPDELRSQHEDVASLCAHRSALFGTP